MYTAEWRPLHSLAQSSVLPAVFVQGHPGTKTGIWFAVLV